jgi:hypothetical protein
MVVGAFHERMSAIFVGSVATPEPEITCPKYSTEGVAKVHFWSFALS